MGVCVLLIGKSGSGKSTSLRNFHAGEVGVINVMDKMLPFPTDIKTLDTSDYGMIKATLKRSKADTIVIDDAGYLLTRMFMEERDAGNIFAFYNELANSYWDLIRFVTKELPKNRIVYFVMHEDKSESGDIKPKTIGKLLDEKVCIEGMFTVVLRSIFSGGKHLFKTQTNGFDIAKSPLGMFEDAEIDNDLQYVDKTIREYWKIPAASAPAQVENTTKAKESK